MKNTARIKFLLSLIVLIGCGKASGQGEAKEICSINLQCIQMVLVLYLLLVLKLKYSFGSGFVYMFCI